MVYRKSLLITVFAVAGALVSVFAGGVEYSRLMDSRRTTGECITACGSLSADTLPQMCFLADSLAPGDVPPVFPGGDEALRKYVNEHLIYPTIARENGIEGCIPVLFTVMSDGSVSDIRLLRTIDPSLDREALRFMKAMPRWTPGRRHAGGGKPAAMRCVIMLTFGQPNQTGLSRTISYTPLSTDAFSQMFSLSDELAPGDVAPCFPGGENGLRQYINDNLVYPTIARENGIEGKVPVAFTVMPDGTLADIQLVHAIDPSLDREARRLVRAMPLWTPGRRHAAGGKPVAMRCVVVVTFKLADEEP